MTTEKVWGLGAVPGDYFSPARKGSVCSLVPPCFVPGLSLPFILAQEKPELKSPFHPSPIATLLVLIPPPASSTLILPPYGNPVFPAYLFPIDGFTLPVQTFLSFFLHPSANLQATCAGMSFLTISHSLLISMK